MAKFHFKVCDRFRRILAQNSFEELDVASAHRAVITAVTLFTVMRGFQPDGFVEIYDFSEHLIMRLNMRGDLL